MKTRGKSVTLSLSIAILLGSICIAYASMPSSAKVTNIKADGFTISWLTDRPEIGYLNYGATPSLGSTAYDDRGETVLVDTHHITVSELLPKTLYYYDIGSDGTVDDNSGAHYTITTAPEIQPRPGSDVAYGQAYMPDGSAAEACVVYTQLEDNDGLGSPGLSQEGSSACDTGGWWWFDLTNLRTADLNAYFEYSPAGDNEILWAKAGKNTPAFQVIDTGEDQPAADMMLGWVLNLDVPWRQKELYSSAASCQTILNYVREGAGAAQLSQNDIYAYGHPYNLAENSTIPEMDPNGIDAALGHFDPYDVSDPDGYGDPFKGYNFDVDTYGPGEIDEYMRDIVHWMAYPVTQNYWRLNGELAARPNTPAAIPLYGNYDNWVVVTGAATSNNPIPYPDTDPWFTPDFTVYGFWLTDPAIEGIGEHSYVTASECEATYFKTVTTGDSYDGLYLQVAEPPAYPSNAKITIALPRSINNEDSSSGIAAASGGETAEAGPQDNQREKHNRWIKCNWRDLIDPLLFTDPSFKSAFDNSRAGRPLLVRRADEPALDYYLVPFTKRCNGMDKVSCVLMLDQTEKHFKSATWVEEPDIYLPLSRAQAFRLAIKDMFAGKRLNRRKRYSIYRRLIKLMKVELVWQPNGYSSSPFFPYWKVSLFSRVWYVTQDGRVIKQ